METERLALTLDMACAPGASLLGQLYRVFQ
jgi:hypothetical protein